MRHPELKQLYEFALQSENLIKNKNAQETLNKVNINWEKNLNYYDLEEQRFVKLCLEYNESKEEEQRQRLAEMFKKMSVTTRTHDAGQ